MDSWQLFDTVSLQEIIAIPNDEWHRYEFDGEVYLIVPAADKRLRLNATAISIFDALSSDSTIAALLTALAEQYAVEINTIYEDVVNTVWGFADTGVVIFSNIEDVLERNSLRKSLPENHLREPDSVNPFDFFDAIFCINASSRNDRWTTAQNRFERLGIDKRVIRFPAIMTPDSHHIGCALSHRKLIQIAEQHGLDSILVLEDDALFLDTILQDLPKSLAQLKRKSWHIFYLGAYDHVPSLDRSIEGVDHLLKGERLTCTHAISYHSRVYKRLLNELPDNVLDMTAWCDIKVAIDQYLTHPTHAEEVYVADPMVSTQIELLNSDDPLANRFA